MCIRDRYDSVAKIKVNRITVKELKRIIPRMFRRDEIEIILHSEFGYSSFNTETQTGYKEFVFKLILYLEHRAQLGRFVETLLKSRPNDPKLIKIAHDLGIHSVKLEREIKKSSMKDTNQFILEMENISKRMCLIQLAEHPVGTGILIGPNLILTASFIVDYAHLNWHRELKVRFDFRNSEDGQVVNYGHFIELDENQPLAAGYIGMNDIRAEDDATLMKSYSVLRLSTAIGTDLYSKTSDRSRGWISLKDNQAKLGAEVYLLHHPRGMALQVSQGTIVEVTQNLIRYSANSLSGSSGGATFDSDFNLIGMHLGRMPLERSSENIGFGLRSNHVLSDMKLKGNDNIIESYNPKLGLKITDFLRGVSS